MFLGSSENPWLYFDFRLIGVAADLHTDRTTKIGFTFQATKIVSLSYNNSGTWAGIDGGQLSSQSWLNSTLLPLVENEVRSAMKPRTHKWVNGYSSPYVYTWRNHTMFLPESLLKYGYWKKYYDGNGTTNATDPFIMKYNDIAYSWFFANMDWSGRTGYTRGFSSTGAMERKSLMTKNLGLVPSFCV